MTKPKKTAQPASTGEHRYIPLALIDESPTNPRKRFNEAKLAELADSIRASGVLQAVLVRPSPATEGRFELVCGARRFRASKLARTEGIPANVRALSDAAAFEAQLTENNQRDDVSPLEEAEAVLVLRERFLKPKHEIAVQLGHTSAWVESRLTLGRLPDVFKALLEEHAVDIGGALVLARVPEDRVESMATTIRDVHTREGRTVSRSWIANRLAGVVHELDGAPFDTEDPTLVDAAGACTDCTKRTGAQASLFGEITDDDRCLDAACWSSKLDARWQLAVTDARRRRLPVIGDRLPNALRADGYERADSSAWVVREYDKKLREVVSEGDLAIARDEDGRVVEMVTPEAMERLRKECEKQHTHKDDDSDDESGAPSSGDGMSFKEKQRARQVKSDEDSLASVYRPRFVAELERAESNATAEDLLRSAFNELIPDGRLVALRRGVIAPGEEHDTMRAQLLAWAETADAAELALAIVEDLSGSEGYRLEVASVDGDIVLDASAEHEDVAGDEGEAA